jgi:vacuolar-type H+-ATPase subunit C/Vma6
MAHRDDRKQQIASQLGVSVKVLEQYLQLKRAEVDEVETVAAEKKGNHRSPTQPRNDTPLQL